MAQLNAIFIEGRMVTPLSITKKNKTVGTFVLAHSKYTPSIKKGEYAVCPKSSYYKVTCFDDREIYNLNRVYKKGLHLLVEGELAINEYTSTKTGNKVSQVYIKANKFHYITTAVINEEQLEKREENQI